MKNLKPRTFDSMKAAAAAMGVPLFRVAEAKAAGCPAFRSNRVYEAELGVWLAANPPSPQEDETPPEAAKVRSAQHGAAVVLALLRESEVFTRLWLPGAAAFWEAITAEEVDGNPLAQLLPDRTLEEVKRLLDALGRLAAIAPKADAALKAAGFTADATAWLDLAEHRPDELAGRARAAFDRFRRQTAGQTARKTRP